MGSVIVLITLLVGLLSGLTEGLARQNVSAVDTLPADRLVFADPGRDGGEADLSFEDSRLDAAVWQRMSKVEGVTSAEPLGIGVIRGEHPETGGTVPVTAFGVTDPAGGGSALVPGDTVRSDVPDGTDATEADEASESPRPGTVVLSEDAAEELAAAPGDRLTFDGTTLRVVGVGGEAMHSHTPVVWISLADWQRFADVADPREPEATVVALSTSGDASSALRAVDGELATRTVPLGESLSAIGSYQAENGSLQLMRVFLFAISALVVGAFFTVWTIQRGRDVAVLKALGASTGRLLTDALGQALVLLALGVGAGAALAAAVGATVASGGTVPFVLGAATVLGPSLVMVALGVLGAALAVRRITAVDPLTALGSAR